MEANTFEQTLINILRDQYTELRDIERREEIVARQKERLQQEKLEVIIGIHRTTEEIKRERGL